MVFTAWRGLAANRRAALVAIATLVALMTVFVSSEASYGVRTITALLAAIVLLRSARRHDGLAWTRRLFAVALLAGATSGVASAMYELVVGHSAPIGWLSDWIYLSYGPIVVAAVLTVPRTSSTKGGTVRALADGVVAAGSLWFSVIAVFVSPAHLGEHLGAVERGVTLAFPLLPVFSIAVLLSALPRVAPAHRRFLTWAGAGIGVLGAGDVGVAIASWHSWYRPDSWIAALGEAGLLLMLRGAVATTTAGAAPIEASGDADVRATNGFLVVAGPYCALVIGLGIATREMFVGRGISSGQLMPLIIVGAALVVRQLASGLETGRLVAALAARERAASEEARTDPLTGLANRTEFLHELEAALVDPGQHQVAVALLDLNDFKDINDTRGHGTGDLVLHATAERLSAAVPEGCIARLGGDEFAIFAPHSGGHGQELGASIAAAFTEPIRLGKQLFRIRASIGVVIDERPPGHSRPGDAAHLLAHADVAMYEAKRSKHLHDVPVVVLAGRARSTATATIRIREEICHPELDQFRVVYQPVVDLHTGAIVAAEALLRWKHPEFGEIGPDTFIPLAERVGSINMLGEFVLKTAVDDLAEWSAGGDGRFAVGVNVSPRQLADSSLIDHVTTMLAAKGLRPQQLSLELTEEAFADDIEAVVTSIAALRAAGLWIAVDDFGTGYSSLNYLRRFDVNVVKIDKEFVQASATEPRTDILVRSVISMAGALDMMCVAEGIETLDHLDRIRSSGCRYGQGYLLARPMPGADLGKLVRSDHVYPVGVSNPSPPEPAKAVPRLRQVG